MTNTRTLTITCTPALARTLVELLLTEDGAFSISSEETSSQNRAPTTSHRRTRGAPRPTNRGLVSVLEAGLIAESKAGDLPEGERPVFHLDDVRKRAALRGLAASSSNSALSLAHRHGIVERLGNAYWLSPRGRKLCKDWNLTVST